MVLQLDKAMASTLMAHFVLPPEKNGYNFWEDQTFFKWRKRDPHVNLHCHESVEGKD